jgi:hypothetical protein
MAHESAVIWTDSGEGKECSSLYGEPVLCPTDMNHDCVRLHESNQGFNTHRKDPVSLLTSDDSHFCWRRSPTAIHVSSNSLFSQDKVCGTSKTKCRASVPIFVVIHRVREDASTQNGTNSVKLTTSSRHSRLSSLGPVGSLNVASACGR